MSDFVKASHVFVNNPATTVDEGLAFLAKQAVELGITENEAAVLAAFQDRETEGSTGMTGGFAVPHCKSTAVKGAAIVVVKFAGEVDWESMEGEPIRVAVALYVPDNRAATTYLRILSQIAVELMSEEFREKMLATDDPETIAELVNAGLNV